MEKWIIAYFILDLIFKVAILVCMYFSIKVNDLFISFLKRNGHE